MKRLYLTADPLGDTLHILYVADPFKSQSLILFPKYMIKTFYLVSSVLLIIPELFTGMGGQAIVVLITLNAYRETNDMTGAATESPVSPE